MDVSHEIGPVSVLPTLVRVFETKVLINAIIGGSLPSFTDRLTMRTVPRAKKARRMLTPSAIRVSPTNLLLQSESNHIPLSKVFLSAVAVETPVAPGLIGPFSETRTPPRVDNNAPHSDPVEGVTICPRGKGEPSGPVILSARVDHKGNVSLTVRVSAVPMLIPSHHSTSFAVSALARWASNSCRCRLFWMVLLASAWVSSSPRVATFTEADGQHTRAK